MCLREWISLGHESLFPVLQAIAWSINQLGIGLHPEKDWNNELFKGKYAANTQISGLVLVQTASMLTPHVDMCDCSGSRSGMRATLSHRASR